MDRHPIPPERRRRFEAIIRIVDMFAYVVVFGSGVYAIAATPTTVVDELAGAEWLIPMWATLLLGGGVVGFAGRLSRRWMLEVPSTWLSFAGILIYFVVLGRFAFTSITATTAALMLLVALAFIVRRWAELQIFAIDPDQSDFRSRMAEALRRRTQDFPHRHR